MIGGLLSSLHLVPSPMPSRPFSPITRRTFLAESAAAAVALTVAPRLSLAAESAPEFHSQWNLVPDRVWLGAEFWANPLQDWRIAGGRLECVKAAPRRSAHVLTRQLGEGAGTLTVSVKLGRVGGGTLNTGKGSAGFSIGVQGPLKEYRNNLVHGTGLNIGLRAGGTLFIGDGGAGKSVPVDLNAESVELQLAAEPAGDKYRIKLTALDAKDGRVLGEVERTNVPAEYLVGNLALVANYGPRLGGGANRNAANINPAGVAKWWFADWKIAGTKVEAHPERAFGPLLFNQYTLHNGTLKMTAQMPPLGEKDDQTVRLQVQRDGAWQTVSEEKIHPVARTATFRLEKWNDQADVPYRLAYTLRANDGSTREHFLEGTVRRDPVDAESLSVADISCNAHYAFPNTACVAGVAKLNPDMIAFTGDQYYESSGGFGVDRSSVENAVLDALHKWTMHGWTWRELLRDRPSISIPDDHDVYHGNLWGEDGAAAPGSTAPDEARGGYKMMPEFVNAVHRMQTAHHPDSPAKSGKQGITGYYGPLTYGRISFAILADRQYKSGPDGKVPPTTSGRADHVNDPNFDPKTADLPGLELLGAAQLDFIRTWAQDWRGADMKAAISQTLFTAMATHHGKKDGLLIADYDTNAWPQTARNAAVRELRKAFAFHLAGDQHLPAVVQYGVDEHRDGVVAFASPAVNNLYPRWFRPPNTDKVLGDFTDSFGHPLTVLACANPEQQFRKGVLEAETDKSSGYGLVRFNKRNRTITVECWPLLADPLKRGTQFAGWPVTVNVLDNYSRKAAANLPRLEVKGIDKPVVQVVAEDGGEIVYTLRIPASGFEPKVFAPGKYTLRITDPEAGKFKEITGVEAKAGNTQVLEVAV